MKKHTRSSFDEVSTKLGDVEGRGIDDAVEKRLHHRKLNRRIARQSQTLFASLSAEDRMRWFAWEQLLARRSYERDRALFDVAFASGVANGRAEHVGARVDPVLRELVDHVRHSMAMHPATPSQKVFALLHIALSLARKSQR